MPTSQIDTVTFTARHLEGALALSRQAGWPHRLEDWQMALALSEGVAMVDDSGRVVATVLVTPYKDGCATINMVIVDEAMRGRGLGRKLMDTALAMAGERPLRLVATAEGLPLYQKLGFKETGTVLQHQGSALTVQAPQNVEAASQADIPAIADLDRRAFGADRDRLIAYLAGIGRFAVIRRDGNVSGFAALRDFGRGELVGPVVAADADDARSLISYFAALRPGSFLRIDTTSDTGLGPFLSGLGLAHVGGGIAMNRPARAPAHDSTIKTFALASQAMG